MDGGEKGLHFPLIPCRLQTTLFWMALKLGTEERQLSKKTGE